jgi:predicted membrane protein
VFNFSIFGGTEVKGQYKPEPRNIYTMLAGGMEIDLSQVEMPDAPVTFIICTFFGGAKVIVPPGTEVDIGGIVLLGGKKSSVDQVAVPSKGHVKIRFNCLAGGLEVTSKAK